MLGQAIAADHTKSHFHKSWYKLYRPLHVLYPVSPLVVKKDSTKPAWLHLHTRISGEVIDVTLIHVLCCFSMVFIFAICLPSHRL